MNNFYCGLHLLVNFTRVADKIIRDFEVNLNEKGFGAEAHVDTKMFTKNNESGTVKLVQTASKCLARGADDKSEFYGEFKTFLLDKYVRRNKNASNLLIRFRENRFNILFCNAEMIFFFLLDCIKELFAKVNRPTNRLQKAVFYRLHKKKHTWLS